MSDRDRLLGHDYDGIAEYDNPLPGWWTWLFVATIAFSVGYYAYYQLGPGPSVVAQYDDEMRAAAARQAAAPVAATSGEDALKALAGNAQAMASAKEIFATRCMPCHGPEGQGLIGPNLTDDYWLHGSTLPEIRHTISEGVIEKGMVPWKDQLKPEELDAIAAYVGTLRGTHPPNPKPPQGVNAKGEAAPEPPTAGK